MKASNEEPVREARGKTGVRPQEPIKDHHPMQFHCRQGVQTASLAQGGKANVTTYGPSAEAVPLQMSPRPVRVVIQRAGDRCWIRERKKQQ